MNENKIVELATEQALVLDCGKSLKSFKTAYTTYGKLNDAKDNAIFIMTTFVIRMGLGGNKCAELTLQHACIPVSQPRIMQYSAK